MALVTEPVAGAAGAATSMTATTPNTARMAILMKLLRWFTRTVLRRHAWVVTRGRFPPVRGENVFEPEGAFPTHWWERALRLAEDQGRPPIQAPPMEP